MKCKHLCIEKQRLWNCVWGGSLLGEESLQGHFTSDNAPKKSRIWSFDPRNLQHIPCATKVRLPNISKQQLSCFLQARDPRPLQWQFFDSLVMDWARLSRSHGEEIDPNCKRGMFFVTYPLHEAVKQGNVPRPHCFRPFGKRNLTAKRVGNSQTSVSKTSHLKFAQDFFDFVNRGKQLRPTLLTGYWSLEPTAVRWTGLFVIMPTTMPRNMVGKRCWRFLRDTSSPQCIHIRYVHHCLWGRFSTFLRPEVSKSSLQKWGQILWQLRMRKTSGCKFAGEQVCERRQ